MKKRHGANEHDLCRDRKSTEGAPKPRAIDTTAGRARELKQLAQPSKPQLRCLRRSIRQPHASKLHGRSGALQGKLETKATVRDALSCRPQELFSKLRFSYLEQVTKEKFLRAIVGDPPLIVEQQENIELEAQLATAKAELKAQKEEVASMTAELEARGRDLSRRKTEREQLSMKSERC